MKLQKYRDLSLLQLDEQNTLVMACDSCGAIGMKPYDMLEAPPELVGALTTRVVLLELMCIGSRIQCVYNTLSCEMKPTGEKIIEGIHSEIIKAGLDIVALSGSTEENFQTLMTATGIVGIGICEGSLRMRKVAEGDYAVLIAQPKCGEQIKQAADNELLTYEEVRTLLKMEKVMEIVPCGSKGVLHEANQIATCNDLNFSAIEINHDLLYSSAGTAACAVVAIQKDGINTLTKTLGKNRVRIIGYYE